MGAVAHRLRVYLFGTAYGHAVCSDTLPKLGEKRHPALAGSLEAIIGIKKIASGCKAAETKAQSASKAGGKRFYPEKQILRESLTWVDNDSSNDFFKRFHGGGGDLIANVACRDTRYQLMQHRHPFSSG
jgi:hypothetical protein